MNQTANTANWIALAALIVSVLALVASVVSGVANFMYTRRTFNAANSPRVTFTQKRETQTSTKIYPEIGETVTVTWFFGYMTNLSNTIPIFNVTVEVLVKTPKLKMSAVYLAWKSERIDPLGSVGWNSSQYHPKERLLHADSFEDFISEKLPNCLKKVSSENISVQTLETIHWEVNKLPYLTYTVIFRYTPGVSGAKEKMVKEKAIKLTANSALSKGAKEILTKWEQTI